MPAGREARRLAAPERRVGRERDQLAQVRAQRVDDPDRAIGVADCDVHVQPVDQLTAPGVLQLLDDRLVAVARHDALSLEEAERVGARRAEAQPAARRAARPRGARIRRSCRPTSGTSAQTGVWYSTSDANSSGDDARRELAVRLGLEDPLRARHQVERRRVQEHVLLLDADRERRPGAEAVVDDAGRRWRVGTWLERMPPGAGRHPRSARSRLRESTDRLRGLSRMEARQARHSFAVSQPRRPP